MKTLVCGDSHLKMSILEDSKSFINQLLIEVHSNRYDQIILLGDQMNDFAVVRSEILSLWTSFFAEASKFSRIIALVGNHDLAGAEGGTNPMEAFKYFSNVTIVDSPIKIDGINYSPFIRSNEEFEAYCRSLPAGEILFCHQSFNGAMFENGFYDPSGANTECVSHLKAVVIGHVHKEQSFQNIWYPGTPFQHTSGDAGETKYIYELNLDSKGYNVSRKIQLDMPVFIVLEADDIPTLTKKMEETQPTSQMKVKLIARGTPSEIQLFWQQPVVKNWQSVCKRVSDGLTSIKMSQNTIETKGKTQKEKLEHFIRAKTWRTNVERLTIRAEELLRA